MSCGRVCLLCFNISRFMKPDFTNGSWELLVSLKACFTLLKMKNFRIILLILRPFRQSICCGLLPDECAIEIAALSAASP